MKKLSVMFLMLIGVFAGSAFASSGGPTEPGQRPGVEERKPPIVRPMHRNRRRHHRHHRHHGPARRP
ncbi:MAG TPA: hypothetical protein VN937_04605 [Blastocatellia bacterium]|nr:hypothetical protein [Blastocatellia bacterium]